MAKGKNRTGRYAAGGIVVAAVLYFLGGSPGLNVDLPAIGGAPAAQTTVQTAVTEATQPTETIVEIKDNSVILNGQAVDIERLTDQLSAGQRVVVKSSDAKQLTFDQVKSALEAAGCVVILED